MIAESSDTVIVDDNHYFLLDAVKVHVFFFVLSPFRSFFPVSFPFSGETLALALCYEHTSSLQHDLLTFPLFAQDKSFLVKSDHTSTCPYKGEANYYDLVVDGKTNPAACWYYPNPKNGVKQIKDRVSFWKGVEIN